MTAAVGDLERRRLRWRARRGLLENDLLLARYFERYGDAPAQDEAVALSQLLALPDNDLLDLLLSRKRPDGELDTIAVRTLIDRIRTA